MPDYADLEISLHRRDAESYAVEFRLNRSDSEAEVRPGQGIAELDPDSLPAVKAEMDHQAYGQELGRRLWADPAVKEAFASARKAAQALDVPLHLRLFIGPSARELHDLRWETLRDDTGGPLFTSEQLLFSRYLNSVDWRPVRLHPKGQLQALAVIANPAGYDLPLIDVAGELERVKDALSTKDDLSQVRLTALPGEAGGHATLDRLLECLRDGDYDILYLVCHGALIKNEPCLYLEDEAGLGKPAAGAEFVTRLQELYKRPRLVVLASCESAGALEGEALRALGPRLAEAGIPAVLAMQGKLTQETAKVFMPAFFEELQKDGQIDRAMAMARGKVRDRPDYWMPALFMRLQRGRLWYVSDRSETGDVDLHSLALAIRDEACVPIIGPGLTESWLGTESEIAARWALDHGYPLSPHDQDDLPRIAQYVARRDGPTALQRALREALQTQLRRRCAATIPEKLRLKSEKGEIWSLDEIQEVLIAAGTQCWSSQAAEPHWQLAKLGLPLYITASPGNLLINALKGQRHDETPVRPEFRLCPWNDAIPEARWAYEEQPTAERPLVYHLFGHLSLPASLVLSEDDYFGFLLGFNTNKKKILEAVTGALASKTLLFLGFRMEDWSFRVLFRTLMAQPGGQMRETSVAVQIEPEEGRLLDPRRARRYLDRYFVEQKINIYWGRAEEFLSTLTQYLAER